MQGYNRAGNLKRITTHERRRTRRVEAKARQLKYAALTREQKLATLIPGGSTRQRARLTNDLPKV